jgi:LmbE family N-acetylglucosaminyl deacetylase
MGGWSVAGASLAALLTAALVLAGVLRTWRYRAAFRIAASRDDRCTCRGGHGHWVIAIGAHGFELPSALLTAKGSGFLALTVRTNLLGRVRDPWIEVRGEGVCYRQYFERGAAGQRFLNVSALLQDGALHSGRVALRGRHIRWARQGVLRVFETPTLDGTLMVLAPHPDDAEIASFGLYSHCNAWVVTVTCGERTPTPFGALVPGTTEHAHWSALLRVWDSLHIPELGGVARERCVNLAFPDGRLQQMGRTPEQAFLVGCDGSEPREALRSLNRLDRFRGGPRECSWRELVAELAELLEVARPRLVACPHPLVDPHRDHVATGIALAQALRSSAHRPERLLLYVVHAREVPLYPFGPAETAVSLPPWEDDEWLADSLYSHPLSAETRRAKYFAVEAQHDLRTYDDEAAGPLAATWHVVSRALLALISGTDRRPTSFLRRAPRPNELYYVVSAEGFIALAERARAEMLSHVG